jgi:hypothetical protein
MSLPELFLPRFDDLVLRGGCLVFIVVLVTGDDADESPLLSETVPLFETLRILEALVIVVCATARCVRIADFYILCESLAFCLGMLD